MSTGVIKTESWLNAAALSCSSLRVEVLAMLTSVTLSWLTGDPEYNTEIIIVISEPVHMSAVIKGLQYIMIHILDDVVQP